MRLTRDFKETIRARAARDPKFRKELSAKASNAGSGGDTTTAKTILRDYLSATVGFAEVAEATHIPFEESHADAETDRQPTRRQSFRNCQFLAEPRGYSLPCQSGTRIAKPAVQMPTCTRYWPPLTCPLLPFQP
jgi:hypothetical protein